MKGVEELIKVKNFERMVQMQKEVGAKALKQEEYN